MRSARKVSEAGTPSSVVLVDEGGEAAQAGRADERVRLEA
jgi:hypothetical protein